MHTLNYRYGSLAFTDQTPVSRDETLISREETIIFRDKTLVRRDDAHFFTNETLVSKIRHFSSEMRHTLLDETLAFRDETRLVRYKKLVSREETPLSMSKIPAFRNETHVF